MWQGVGHKSLVFGFSDGSVYVSVPFHVFARAMYPEWDLKFVVGQGPIYGRAVVATDEISPRFVTFLAVVWHVDDDGLLVFKTLVMASTMESL